MIKQFQQGEEPSTLDIHNAILKSTGQDPSRNGPFIEKVDGTVVSTDDEIQVHPENKLDHGTLVKQFEQTEEPSLRNVQNAIIQSGGATGYGPIPSAEKARGSVLDENVQIARCCNIDHSISHVTFNLDSGI